MLLTNKNLISVVLTIEELRVISKALDGHDFTEFEDMDPIEIKLKGEIDLLIKDLG